MSESTLFPVTPEDYGEDYQATYLAMYNDFVRSADTISERRAKANTFFYLVSTGLLAGTTFAAPAGQGLAFLVSIAAMLLCFGWLRSLSSHMTLNAAKFEVIQQMESRLPLAPYRAEWEAYQGGTPTSRHTALTVSEKMVPQVFMVLHGAVGLFGYINWLG